MLKTAFNMLAGALITMGVAFATVGTPPTPATGPGLVDGTWLNGLASGQNRSYQYGFTAVGTTQATSLQLPAGVYMLEVDTADSGGASGVALPPCLQGTQVVVIDNTAFTFDVYPSINNNPVTAAQDKINNTTSTTVTTYAKKLFVCAKNGVWIGG